MSVICTEPRFVGLINGHGYEHYEREVYCTCGKKIGTQSKYYNWTEFSFDSREKNEYRFCPYCGHKFKD